MAPPRKHTHTIPSSKKMKGQASSHQELEPMHKEEEHGNP